MLWDGVSKLCVVVAQDSSDFAHPKFLIAAHEALPLSLLSLNAVDMCLRDIAHIDASEHDLRDATRQIVLHEHVNDFA